MQKHCDVSLAGKTVLITGGNSGVGFKTAETMLHLGAAVILACRDPARAAQAAARLTQDFPGGSVRTVPLDLADFASIDAFAANLPDVDVLINNAGVFHRPGQKTRDGFPLVMGTNYLGVYRLCEAVLPRLLACGHDVTLINTVSLVYKVARVDYARFYRDDGSYARSKLCLARYTAALVQRCAGTNVHVYMTHPGITITGIASHLFGRIYKIACWMPFNSTEKSSLSAAWLLAHPLPEGSIVGPNKLFGGWGYPRRNRVLRRARQGTAELVSFTEAEIRRAAAPASAVQKGRSA
ncbi:MAG: SDR family NAD(P)-dependent oxidoreductase [Clostridia bacterium]|nr:SDR family NAD(P)-dependent oxidoreductase [Clostridia bacterium]